MGDRGVFSSREGHVGLDHYQVRSWIGWHHHTVLAMLALTILVADAHHATPSPRDRRLRTTQTDHQRKSAT
ncbi:MAG: hypothetical protein M3460_23905 [Actinomycetota bacterium]|nr:hypothetical protein [Actinomycetota bacterium]